MFCYIMKLNDKGLFSEKNVQFSMMTVQKPQTFADKLLTKWQLGVVTSYTYICSAKLYFPGQKYITWHIYLTAQLSVFQCFHYSRKIDLFFHQKSWSLICETQTAVHFHTYDGGCSLLRVFCKIGCKYGSGRFDVIMSHLQKRRWIYDTVSKVRSVCLRFCIFPCHDNGARSPDERQGRYRGRGHVSGTCQVPSTATREQRP